MSRSSRARRAANTDAIEQAVNSRKQPQSINPQLIQRINQIRRRFAPRGYKYLIAA